jgi:hypothetical protein
MIEFVKSILSNKIVLTIALVAVLILIGVTSSKFLGDDNQVEEESEVKIKDITSMDIDLSPESKETSIPIAN